MMHGLVSIFFKLYIQFRMRAKLFISGIVAFLFFTNAIGSVSLIMPDLSGANGTQITVPVKVKDFVDIVSIQGTIQFDQTIVSYVSIQDFGLPTMTLGGNFGISQASSGILTFTWFDGTLAGVTLADSAVIFSVTFNIIGSSGQMSTLNFTDTPTLVEIVNNSFVTETVLRVNGSVTVDVAGPLYDLTLSLDTITGSAGSNVNVSLRGTDFTNINSIQGTIKFDPTVVTYSSISYFGLPGMAISDFNVTQAATGKIIFLWSDATLQGINMADDAALFTINFNLSGIAGSSTLLKYASIPAVWEITDSLFNILSADTIMGRISIASGTVGIDNQNTSLNSSDFELKQNSPNPFSEFTRFIFVLPIETTASISVFDLLGNKVYETSGLYKAGENTITWNGVNNKGEKLNSGMYYYRLNYYNRSVTRKMMLIK
jgi:hypothetical protein